MYVAAAWDITLLLALYSSEYECLCWEKVLLSKALKNKQASENSKFLSSVNWRQSIKILYCTIKQSIALEFDYMISIPGNISSSRKHPRFKIEISVATPSLMESLQNFMWPQNRYLAHFRTSSFSSNSNYFLCYSFGIQGRLVLISRKKLSFLQGKGIDSWL